MKRSEMVNSLVNQFMDFMSISQAEELAEIAVFDFEESTLFKWEPEE